MTIITVRTVSNSSSANDPFCAQGNDLAVHLAYAQEFDNAGAAFVNKRFQGQQALAKAQGASAAGVAAPPSPVAAAPPPAVATLVRPGAKSQVANSTAAAVSISVGKAVGKPWAFAMKDVSKTSEVVKRGERIPGPAASAQWEVAKKLLKDKMGGAV